MDAPNCGRIYEAPYADTVEYGAVENIFTRNWNTS